MSALWILPLVLCVSWGGTYFLRRYALMDVPNERSSHSVPTPRGGGVAIVLAFILGMVLLFEHDLVQISLFFGVVGTGLVVAIIGFADDHGHIAAKWRLIGHFVASIWALYWLGGLSPIQVFGVTYDLGWLGHILACTYLVWMLNLYNFMDGIDLLASAECVFVCLGMCIVFYVQGHVSLIFYTTILAMAVLGFLFWNYPPAKIFMGDAGSGFLGIVLGVLTIICNNISSELLWSCLILLAVFIVDATITLFSRLFNGENIYQAHRTHAYQIAAVKLNSHLCVIKLVSLVNFFWLLPLAYAVATKAVAGVVGLVVAYFPLIVLVIRCRAVHVSLR
ncbi:MraY family glycosyltransferase [Pseudomonas marincola]|uniref:MraY family glycosyltransferase n=1 Tax=Pseudomonas marincola TaxID=437900 RepID=UPI0008E9604D|nr:glycosyltransferase family 4 protein [Pseudomonas marincola]SFT76637.1 Fuc2NAc and GlcNAc transferase [Pseudomonas marincola]